jgi:hypothetical protein
MGGKDGGIMEKMECSQMETCRLRNALWGVGAELLDSKSVKDKRAGQLLYDIGDLLSDTVGPVQEQAKHTDSEIAEALRNAVDFAKTCRF